MMGFRKLILKCAPCLFSKSAEIHPVYKEDAALLGEPRRLSAGRCFPHTQRERDGVRVQTALESLYPALAQAWHSLSLCLHFLTEALVLGNVL